MDACRREPDDDVARLDPRAVDQVATIDDPDARAGEVELLVSVDARQLRRLAAEQRAAGGPADLRRPLDQLGDLLELDPVRRDVVEEEERLGARRQDVVDAVRGEVGAAPAELAGAAREHELRADAVGRRRQQPPLVEREEAGEAAERADRAGGRGARDGRAQPLDDAFGGRERDSGALVRPLLAHRSPAIGRVYEVLRPSC